MLLKTDPLFLFYWLYLALYNLYAGRGLGQSQLWSTGPRFVHKSQRRPNSHNYNCIVWAVEQGVASYLHWNSGIERESSTGKEDFQESASPPSASPVEELEPDSAFLLKLCLVSAAGEPVICTISCKSISLRFSFVAGALVVKYGSLLIDAPFRPSAWLAWFLVLMPPVVYSVILLLKSETDD
jgi:hypothetical protein